MPLEDVSDLVTRWQRARSPAERARVAAVAARTLRSLSVDERRVLAQGLAERGAPGAAARLASYGSGVLSTRQLSELATSLQSVDRAQLDALATSLSDPAERRRLAVAAAAAVGDSLDVPPPPHGQPRASQPPPPGTAVPLPPPVEPPAVPADHDVSPELPADEVDEAEEPAEAVGAVEADEHGHVAEPEPVDDDPATANRAAPVARFDPTPTLVAIDRADSVRARLAAATNLAGTPLTSDDLTAVLRRLPDGWQRRTVARRLLAAGGVTDVDAEQVLTSFERLSDRTAVAHVLVDGDLAHVETVTDHLDPGAAHRLRRRTSGAA